MFKRIREKIRRILHSEGNWENRGRRLIRWINYNYENNKYIPDNHSIMKRGKVIFCFFSVIMIVFFYYLTIQSGIVRSANKKVDMRLDSALKEAMVQNTIEGSILDRNGKVITKANKIGEVSTCKYPKSYGSIVGYESKVYGSSGLRNLYKNELYTPFNNKKYGATITTCTDAGLQNFAYKLLGKNVGSIVIEKNSTGEILAMASRNAKDLEFNVNKIDESYEKYIKVPGFFYNNCLQADDAPGSTFKIVTATALLDTQNGEFIYNDTGNYHSIHNMNNKALGKIDLKLALRYSSNTYFAKAGVDIVGKEGMKDTISKFKIGENVKLDCGILQSSVSFNTKSELAMISFGQGKVTLSPLSISMIMQAVQNNGIILKPFLIKAINDEETSPELLSNVTSEATAKKLKEMLADTASYYGFENGYYAKTGTAQTGTKYDHIYLVVSNASYTAVISHNRSTEKSGVLVPIAKKLFEYIELNLE